MPLIVESASLSSPAEPESASAGMRITILIAIVLPFLGLVACILLLWGYGFRWIDLALLTTLYYLTGLGVTLGFHRLFTHRSFETTGAIKVLLAILGSMAVQGPLFKWVAMHRRHHQHSDTHEDPHSPHVHGGGVLGALRGFWHAHVGWLFQRDPENLYHHVRDLTEDARLRWVSNLFPVWVLLGLAIPAVVGGLVSGTWFGALLGFLWGGLARVFLVHHTTWSINSACHVWGGQPFRSSDESRNNVVFGLLAMGEGWHNNHHAFPTSARHGLQWWQLDLTYLIIRGLQWVGWAWEVRLPGPQALALRARSGC